MMRGHDHSTLVPDPPRIIPAWFSLRRMRAMIFCGVVFVVVGVVLGAGIPVMFFVLGGYVLPTVDLSLDCRHTAATGVIISRRLLTHTNVNGRHPWKIGFQFQTPSGASVDAVGYTFDESVRLV